MELNEEITLRENIDTSLFFNMYCERQSVFASHNKIKANKLFEVIYQKYLDERIKNGRKRMTLYGLRQLEE